MKWSNGDNGDSDINWEHIQGMKMKEASIYPGAEDTWSQWFKWKSTVCHFIT